MYQKWYLRLIYPGSCRDINLFIPSLPRITLICPIEDRLAGVPAGTSISLSPVYPHSCGDFLTGRIIILHHSHLNNLITLPRPSQSTSPRNSCIRFKFVDGMLPTQSIEPVWGWLCSTSLKDEEIAPSRRSRTGFVPRNDINAEH